MVKPDPSLVAWARAREGSSWYEETVASLRDPQQPAHTALSILALLCFLRLLPRPALERSTKIYSSYLWNFDQLLIHLPLSDKSAVLEATLGSLSRVVATGPRRWEHEMINDLLSMGHRIGLGFGPSDDLLDRYWCARLHDLSHTDAVATVRRELEDAWLDQTTREASDERVPLSTFNVTVRVLRLCCAGIGVYIAAKSLTSFATGSNSVPAQLPLPIFVLLVAAILCIVRARQRDSANERPTLVDLGGVVVDQDLHSATTGPDLPKRKANGSVRHASLPHIQLRSQTGGKMRDWATATPDRPVLVLPNEAIPAQEGPPAALTQRQGDEILRNEIGDCIRDRAYILRKPRFSGRCCTCNNKSRSQWQGDRCCCGHPVCGRCCGITTPRTRSREEQIGAV